MVIHGSSLKDKEGIFNPNVPTSDIYRTWTNLCKYRMQNFFTEEDLIKVFLKVVEGEAVSPQWAYSGYHVDKKF
jgi:hypothetical protein